MKIFSNLKSLIAVSLALFTQSLPAQETSLQTFFFEAEVTASESGNSNSAYGIGRSNEARDFPVGKTLSGYLTVDFSRIDSDESPFLGIYSSAPGNIAAPSTTQYTSYSELNFVDVETGLPFLENFFLQPEVGGSSFVASERYRSEFRVGDNNATAISGNPIEVRSGGTYGAIVTGPNLGTPEGDSLSFSALTSLGGRGRASRSTVEILLSSLDEMTLIGDQLTPDNFDLSLFDDASLLYYDYSQSVNVGSPGHADWTVAEAQLTTLTLLPVPEPSTWLLTLLSVSGLLFNRRR